MYKYFLNASMLIFGIMASKRLGLGNSHLKDLMAYYEQKTLDKQQNTKIEREREREREREKERERPGIKYEPVQARRLAPYVTSNQLWSPDSLQIDSVSITEASPPLFIYSPIRFMGIWPETAKKNSKPRRNHHQWVDRSPCNGCRRTELMRNLSIN